MYYYILSIKNYEFLFLGTKRGHSPQELWVLLLDFNENLSILTF
jgi:hypothetical protein